MNDRAYIQDYTERYVYQVSRRLPGKMRGDVELELRGLIADMLEARCGQLPPAKKDLDVVLAELGSPAELAAKYRGEQEPRCLIGPALFPQYLLLLKIVLAAVCGGMTIASCLLAFSDPAGNWLLELSRWLGNIFFAGVMSFTWVTGLFAFFQWRGIFPDFYGTGTELPPVPKRQERISPWESIASIVFTCLIILLFLFVPISAAVVTDAGTTWVPLFDQEVLRASLVPLILCFALGLVRDSFRLIEGRYSGRLAFVTVACDLPAIVLSFFLFGRGTIWNPTFAAQITAAADFGPDFSFPLLWSLVTRGFVWLLVFAFLLDMGTTLFRVWRYRAPREG